MEIDRIFSFLVPKDHKFFPLFIEVADNLVEASRLLNKLLEEPVEDKRLQYIKAIQDAEHKGDTLTRNLINELNATFITPFEREDIHELVDKMDSIVDLINAAAKRINIYSLKDFPEEFLQISKIIHSAVLEIHMVLLNVKNVNDFKLFKDSCAKISDLESQVDDIYQSSLANLFEKELNAIELLKKRDILSALEKSIDRCEDVAKVFSTLIVKMG